MKPSEAKFVPSEALRSSVRTFVWKCLAPTGRMVGEQTLDVHKKGRALGVRSRSAASLWPCYAARGIPSIGTAHVRACAVDKPRHRRRTRALHNRGRKERDGREGSLGEQYVLSPLLHPGRTQRLLISTRSCRQQVLAVRTS